MLPILAPPARPHHDPKGHQGEPWKPLSSTEVAQLIPAQQGPHKTIALGPCTELLAGKVEDHQEGSLGLLRTTPEDPSHPQREEKGLENCDSLHISLLLFTRKYWKSRLVFLGFCKSYFYVAAMKLQLFMIAFLAYNILTLILLCIGCASISLGCWAANLGPSACKACITTRWAISLILPCHHSQAGTLSPNML